jgi:hypothetical protein
MPVTRAAYDGSVGQQHAPAALSGQLKHRHQICTGGNMKQRIIDLRQDAVTAAHVSDALRLQAKYCYQYASAYLQSQGIDEQHLLAIRYERRSPMRLAAHTGAMLIPAPQER